LWLHEAGKQLSCTLCYALKKAPLICCIHAVLIGSEMIQLSSSRVGWSCHVKREGITIIVRFTCNDIKQVFSEGKKKNNVN